VVVLAALALPLLACRQDMHDQPRYEPFEASTFFGDGMASRQPPAGTVARGHLAADALLHTGKNPDGTLSAQLPAPADAGVLRRGQQRFDIFCSPCHGRLGDGQGMAARRGFKQPPSLHLARLREQPVGYYSDVMTRGFGVMPSYAAALPVEDRWAIAAYLRALQLSQSVPAATLPAADQQALRDLAAGQPAPADAHGATAAPRAAPGEVPPPAVPGAHAPGPALPAASPAVSPTQAPVAP
jgi:mono/diheme cytochrome c family protein